MQPEGSCSFHAGCDTARAWTLVGHNVEVPDVCAALTSPRALTSPAAPPAPSRGTGTDRGGGPTEPLLGTGPGLGDTSVLCGGSNGSVSAGRAVPGMGGSVTGHGGWGCCRDPCVSPAVGIGLWARTGGSPRPSPGHSGAAAVCPCGQRARRAGQGPAGQGQCQGPKSLAVPEGDVPGDRAAGCHPCAVRARAVPSAGSALAAHTRVPTLGCVHTRTDTRGTSSSVPRHFPTLGWTQRPCSPPAPCPDLCTNPPGGRGEAIKREPGAAPASEPGTAMKASLLFLLACTAVLALGARADTSEEPKALVQKVQELAQKVSAMTKDAFSRVRESEAAQQARCPRTPALSLFPVPGTRPGPRADPLPSPALLSPPGAGSGCRTTRSWRSSGWRGSRSSWPSS
uniref:mucin-19-like isoform X2 n=1 Tax=Agelaius phoeniceus TaxID=39638 RepID=UPI0023EC083F|nr:mucin-19-like isoform X2 [Agelaius phoeniceus]